MTGTQTHKCVTPRIPLGKACGFPYAVSLMNRTEAGAALNSIREGSGNHILIVDDDEEIRHVLRMMCELEGYEVIGEAASGVEAVALAMHHQPNLVILDYLMPRMNGEDTAKMLRTICPGIRIVAFSAVLEEKPDWSDTFLNKERISEVMPLLERLLVH
ncbi:MAG: two-component system, NarL family, response regulator EvgA [Actinomycetota bacterium]|nr:two-component system, NarL family, response regulator EvgA [Actinomycetota bacterium]